MVKMFFWIKDGEGISVDLSLQVKILLETRARRTGKRATDILREVFQLYGRVAETDLVNYLNLPSIRPS